MTAEDHLKNAYTELQRAADAVKRDVHQLQNDLGDIKQMSNSHLARLTEELKLVRQQQGQPSDSQQKRQLGDRINDLQRQITDKQREMTDELKRVSDLIRQKERDVTDILTQARTVAPF